MNQVLVVKGTPYRSSSMIRESSTSGVFMLSISSRYFPPNFASALASVSVVRVSFANMNTSALASGSCDTCPAALASSATP